MKKTFYLVLAFGLIAAIAVSGCLGQPKTAAFVGGYDGLKMSFTDLPESIFAGVPFRLSVMVENAGETTVFDKSATFVLNNAKILNISNESATIYNNDVLIASKKVATASIPGGRKLISWNQAKFTGTVLTEAQKVPIAVDACYPYSTRTLTLVCIGKTNSECEPIADKEVQNSGAPVQVTKFSQIAQEDVSKPGNILLDFGIDVENKNDGDVYKADTICPNINIVQQNYINITNIKLGNKTIVPQLCTSAVQTECCDDLILYQGKGSASCRLTVPAQTDYAEELSLTLNYIYKQRLTTELAVIPR